MSWSSRPGPDHRRPPAEWVARWSAGTTWGGGWLWGDPASVPRVSVTEGGIDELTVAIDGEVQDDWRDLSWSTGRGGDWFDTLAANGGSVTLAGDAPQRAGAPVVISDVDRVHFVGYVEDCRMTDAPGEVPTTSVSLTDVVGRLGRARLEGVDVPGGTLDAVLSWLLARVGVSARVTLDAGISLPVLDAVPGYTGEVLEHVARCERSSNAILVMRPNGDVAITMRVASPDYGARILAGTAVAAPDSHWRLDESSGTLVGSAGYNGTASGSPTYALEGPWGPTGPVALGFDGTDDTVSFGDVYDLTGSYWTIAGWAYWDGSAHDSTLYYKRTTGPDNGCYVYISGSTGRLDFIAQSGGSSIETIPDDAPSCPVGEWFHWAVVRDGSGVVLYVDGSEVARGTISALIPNVTGSMYLGSFGGFANFMDGRMAQFTIWRSVALTRDQVGALMSPGLDLSADDVSPGSWEESVALDSVVNHWSFSKADGTVIADDRHEASIAAHGLRAYSMGDYLAADSAHFPAGLRATLEEPRRVLTGATFGIRDYRSHRLLDLAPLDVVSLGDRVRMVMGVSHQVDPGSWSMSVTGDVTRDAIAGGGSVPAPPPVPVDPETRTVVTVEYPTLGGFLRKDDDDDSIGRSWSGSWPVGRAPSGGRRYRTLLAFALTGPSPDYVSLQRATLWFEGLADGTIIGTGTNATTVVRRITEPWGATAEWPGPSVTDEGMATFRPDVPVSGVSPGPTVTVDVTDIVRAEVTSGRKHGFLLRASSESRDAKARRAEFTDSGVVGTRLVLTWLVAA